MKSFSVSPATIQVFNSHTGLGACRRTRDDQMAGGAAKEEVRAAGAGRQWVEILGGGYLGKSRGKERRDTPSPPLCPTSSSPTWMPMGPR